jgi:serine/threonine protein kinase
MSKVSSKSSKGAAVSHTVGSSPKYRISRRIGGGSFGEIYLGIGPTGEKVAVKFESGSAKNPQLRHEYKVYREITSCHGFASVHYFGKQDNYNVLVMDLMGPSLEDLFDKCHRRFSVKTVLQIADQLLDRVDTLHGRHLIHRDIKPANFVIGLGEHANNVYCLDFGLSKRYRHPKTLYHINEKGQRSLTGTPRYASINNHLGVEQSRRDDLESVGYILIYFLKGSLPWQGLKADTAKSKYQLILEKKQKVSIASLCEGIPSQFAEFLAYSRSLKFDAKPDVSYLRKLFRDLYHRQGYGGVGKMWDWDADLPSGAPRQSALAPMTMPVDTGASRGGVSDGNPLRPITAGAVAPSRPQTGWSTGYGAAAAAGAGAMKVMDVGSGRAPTSVFAADEVSRKHKLGQRPATQRSSFKTGAAPAPEAAAPPRVPE